MINVTPAYAYDVIVEIDESSYEATTDASGVSHAFEMTDSAQKALAGAVKRALDYPRGVESVDIQPGYVRVKYAPAKTTIATPEGITAGDIREQLTRAQEIYNKHEARDDALDAVSFGRSFVGVAEPEDPTGADAFVSRHESGSNLTPDVDEPIISLRPHTRDVGRSADDRHLAYEVTIMLDESIYHIEDRRLDPFEWDDFAKEYVQTAFENMQWRNHVPVTEIDVYPTHITIRHHSGSLGQSPKRIATTIRMRLDRAASFPPVRQEPDVGQRGIRQPRLKIGNIAHVAAIPPTDGGAAAFVDRHGLDDVDGTPIHPPEPELAEEVDTDDEKGAWGNLNPFGSGA